MQKGGRMIFFLLDGDNETGRRSGIGSRSLETKKPTAHCEQELDVGGVN
jgi:hypothetical protein